MKQHDLQPCIVCGKGMMHAGDLGFLRLKIEHMAINLRAVQQQHGLELMLGAAAPLAAIMGPDQNMAERVGPAHDVLICQPCALDSIPPFLLLEKAAARDEATEEPSP